MLKQWFVGRKRYSSTPCHPSYIQDPAIIGPLGDKYVVYRTNPIYAEDSQWLADAEVKISPLAIVAPHEPKLHVQAWCSLVCPNHLTTCCSCKPAWIYCDNCHPPHDPHDLHVPKALPALRGHVPKVTLNPANLQKEHAMDVPHYYHVIGPSTPPGDRKCRPNNNYIVNNKNQTGSPPVLHIYINSEFVRGIAVTGSKALPKKLEDPSEALRDDSDTDSLESLRIDEGLFDTEAGGSPTGRLGSETVEGISPTSSHRLLTDSEVAYEAVRDLYEKLSNNRQRQVLTQAVSGSQRTKVLRNYVQNTYETLTKHVRGHYGKLVEVEAKRPPLYLVPIGSLPRGRPLPEVTQAPSDGAKNQSLRVLTGVRIETGKRNDHRTGQPAIVPVDNIVPDVAYEVATSDQFITRRDPKYGDQVVQTSDPGVSKNASTGFFDGLKKRFRQKNYRDACKIIATTLVGLTAFGIITALSLSINRQ